MMFEKLTNESLVAVYLSATRHKLDESFLKALLDEILKRNIYNLLPQTKKGQERN